MRNENLNASLIPNPINSPIAIDIPDLDTPGKTAIPCANPTAIAIFRREELRLDRENIGTSNNTNAVNISPAPTRIRLSEAFSTVDFKRETIAGHLQETAFVMKGICFVLIDERTNETQEFKYDEGIVDYVKVVNANKSPITPVIYFEDTDEETGIVSEIAMQYCNQDYNETIFSYANIVRTREGGTHEVGFKTGITRAVNDFGEKYNLLKNKKLEGNDIREGLTAIISLKLPEKINEVEGQTKGKLNTIEATSIVSNLVLKNV